MCDLEVPTKIQNVLVHINFIMPDDKKSPVNADIVPALKKAKKNKLSYFSLNVFMSTVLFLAVFTTGNGWSMAVNKQFEKKPDSLKYWMFALGMTLLMMLISIGFGEISTLLKEDPRDFNPTSVISAAM